jgi:hypothetical protein
VAAGGGDVADSGEFEDSDGQVPQGCHDSGAVAGAYLGGVFAVGGVADVVQHFNVPVAAYPSGELGRCGLGDGQAGDGVDGDGRPFPAGQWPDAAGEADGLGRVRESQPGCDRGGLEGAVFLAAMPAAALAGAGRDVPPGEALNLGVQARLVLFPRPGCNEPSSGPPGTRRDRAGCAGPPR